MARVFLILILCVFLLGSGSYRSEWKTMTVTAYCPCSVCTDGDGKTATGRDASKDGVAVDPSVIPLGSHVDVPGVKLGPNGNGSWLLADDTGRLIKGDRLDVRFQSHEQAKKFGRKRIRVRVWTK